MLRVGRTSTALILALAVLVAPIALDQCMAACDAHRGAAAGEPSCHHAGAPLARIGQVPTPCGHDHTQTSVATAPAPVAPAFATPVAIVPYVVRIGAPQTGTSRPTPLSIRSRDPLSPHLSSALRV